MIKDFMQMAYQAANESKGDEKKQSELFANSLLEELKKVKGTDISPYLTCEFDVIRMCYVLKLTIPSSAKIFDTVSSTDLGEFRRNVSQYKAIKIRTVEGADGGIDKLEIEVNCDNYKAILAELRKALIQNCKGYDVEELKSSGAPNEMTIKAVYSAIDIDANEIETEYQASFEELLWFVDQHLKNTGKGDFENEEVEVIFNRDMMVNESQVITDINNSSTILSKKTCISQHPYVVDVEQELKQIEEEQATAMEQYGNAFMQKPEDSRDGDEVNGEEPTEE